MNFPTTHLAIIICLISSLVLLMIKSILIREKKTKGIEVFVRYEIINSIFIICIIGMLAYTLIPINIYVFEYNLIPFKDDIRMIKFVGFNSVIFRNILLNIIFFIPFGILGSLVLKIKGKKESLIIIYGFVFSFIIEVNQLIWVGGRVCDINDLIYNTLGTLVGYGMFSIIIRCKKN